MNTFTAIFFALAVASASASHIGLWGHEHHEAHIPSGSVSVGHDGAVIAGPSGSVHTDNGLHGNGAGARISGPSGDIATHGGHAEITGPGHEHHEEVAVHHLPAVHAIHTPIVHVPIDTHTVVAAPSAHATIVGPSSHATIVGPTAHATIIAPSHHVEHVAPIAYHAYVAAPIAHHVEHIAPIAQYAYAAAPIAYHSVEASVPAAWSYSNVVSHHDTVGHGHYGW